MPAVVAMVVVLWILLVLTVVGAVILANMLHRLRHRPAWVFTPLDADDQDSTIDDPDDVEDWLPNEWSYATPAEATAWWSPVGSAPETVVIEGGYRSGAAAVAEKPAPQQIKQIWTIHPDHIAHWEDEASGCPWCRNERV